MAKHLEQHQVPDGMVANLPWGQPWKRWSDKMVERGLKYLANDLDKGPHGDGEEFFPTIFAALGDEASARGIQV